MNYLDIAIGWAARLSEVRSICGTIAPCGFMDVERGGRNIARQMIHARGKFTRPVTGHWKLRGSALMIFNLSGLSLCEFN